jgi:hypothetical protein
MTTTAPVGGSGSQTHHAHPAFRVGPLGSHGLQQRRPTSPRRSLASGIRRWLWPARPSPFKVLFCGIPPLIEQLKRACARQIGLWESVGTPSTQQAATRVITGCTSMPTAVFERARFYVIRTSPCCSGSTSSYAKAAHDACCGKRRRRCSRAALFDTCTITNLLNCISQMRQILALSKHGVDQDVLSVRIAACEINR